MPFSPPETLAVPVLGAGLSFGFSGGKAIYPEIVRLARISIFLMFWNLFITISSTFSSFS